MIVTGVPAGPEVGLRLVIVGTGRTVNATALLCTPATVTTTLPVVAPLGTKATMLVAFQAVIVDAAIPLKVTVLVPCDEPKLVPAMVTPAPTGPEAGVRLLIFGGGTTVKGAPLLGMPATVTTTFPVVAPLGTGTTILVALQLVGTAAVPLNVTLLVPCDAPKLAPLMVTEAPTGAEVGFRLAMLGAGTTVKRTPLLAKPATVTTTFPVVAPPGTMTVMPVVDQFVGDAAVPLKVTVLAPCDKPKFAPVIETVVPAGPDVGLRELMFGVV